jgi:hypothetical protein
MMPMGFPSSITTKEPAFWSAIFCMASKTVLSGPIVKTSCPFSLPRSNYARHARAKLLLLALIWSTSKRGHSAADDPLDKLGLQNMPMAALGTKRTSRDVRLESAFGAKAEVGFRDRQVSLWPTRDIGAFRGWGDPARLPGYLYASPQYLALSGEPKEPGDMAQHECLCMPKVAAWMLDRGTKKVEVGLVRKFSRVISVESSRPKSGCRR